MRADYKQVIGEVSMAIEDDEEFDTVFTPGDVALAWITACRAAVGRGELTEEAWDKIQVDAAQFTSEYAFNRKQLNASPNSDNTH